MLTDEKIDELIKCPKVITEALPRAGMSDDKRNTLVRRKTLKLLSLDSEHQFEIFIRHNTMFIEQFSIGMRFKTNDKRIGKITLIRYNGEHGQNDWSKDNHYKAFHIHRVSEKLLKADILEPKEIEITQKFESFEGTVNEFIRDVHIKNYSDYFPHADKQMSLFEEVPNGSVAELDKK